MELRVLAVGDVVGNPGMDRIRKSLRRLIRQTGADFTVVNGENASVVGITFTYAEDGTPIGLTAAKDMYYVTTSGGYIGDCNFGFEYVNALCKLYGIENSHFVSAQGLDLEGADVEKIMEEATIEAL